MARAGAVVWRAAELQSGATGRAHGDPRRRVHRIAGWPPARALDADGAILWDFDTVQEYKTVNGVKGSGGAIDGPGPVVVNGMVFVNSGYMRFGGAPGNVLLAFEP